MSPALLHSPIPLQTFSAHDSSDNTRLIAVEKNKSNNNSKCFLLLPHLPNFFFELYSFVSGTKILVKVTLSDLNLLQNFFSNSFFRFVSLH